MYGAQQIPGVDSTLRVADVSFQHERYARCEIVKASSALPAANTIIDKLIDIGMLPDKLAVDNTHSATYNLTEAEISNRAEKLATERNFPIDLASRINPSIT